MALGLVHASYSFPEEQALKLTLFAPWRGLQIIAFVSWTILTCSTVFVSLAQDQVLAAQAVAAVPVQVQAVVAVEAAVRVAAVAPAVAVVAQVAVVVVRNF